MQSLSRGSKESYRLLGEGDSHLFFCEWAGKSVTDHPSVMLLGCMSLKTNVHVWNLKSARI